MTQEVIIYDAAVCICKCVCDLYMLGYLFNIASTAHCMIYLHFFTCGSESQWQRGGVGVWSVVTCRQVISCEKTFVKVDDVCWIFCGVQYIL